MFSLWKYKYGTNLNLYIKQDMIQILKKYRTNKKDVNRHGTDRSSWMVNYNYIYENLYIYTQREKMLEYKVLPEFEVGKTSLKVELSGNRNKMK